MDAENACYSMLAERGALFSERISFLVSFFSLSLSLSLSLEVRETDI